VREQADLGLGSPAHHRVAVGGHAATYGEPVPVRLLLLGLSDEVRGELGPTGGDRVGDDGEREE